MDDKLRMTDDGLWLTTIAHHEHFVLRWAKKADKQTKQTAWLWCADAWGDVIWMSWVNFHIYSEKMGHLNS